MRSTPLGRRRQALATLPLAAAVSATLSTSALLLPSTASAQLEEVVVTTRARAQNLCRMYPPRSQRSPKAR